MRTLGAEISTYDVDGETRGIYATEVPGIDSGFAELDQKIPCQFQDPEDVYQPYRLPCFQFRRNDMSPAFERHPWYHWAARGPAKDASEVIVNGVKGYTAYENQWRATQFDISYELMVLARRQQEHMLMLHYALRHFLPPWFIFKVVDSFGELRQYDAGEMSVSNTSELADIADRTVSSSISFLVRGEIDLHDDVVTPAVLSRNFTYSVFKPVERRV